MFRVNMTSGGTDKLNQLSESFTLRLIQIREFDYSVQAIHRSNALLFQISTSLLMISKHTCNGKTVLLFQFIPT